MGGASCGQAMTRCGRTPLYVSVENEHLEAVTTLLALGADPKGSATHPGCNPLHLASQLQHAAMIAAFEQRTIDH